MEVVLLKNCADTIEAEVIKGVLATAGIPCMIVDPTQMAVWFAQGPVTMGGVDVYVFTNTLEEAQKAIETRQDAEAEAAFEKAVEEAAPLEKAEEEEEDEG